jgi:hypothetical protein
MHDPYFNDLDPNQGGTVDMVKYLVPKLKAEGYQFVRVDKVPDINAKLTPLSDPNQPPPADPNANNAPPGGTPAPGPDNGGDKPCP